MVNEWREHYVDYSHLYNLVYEVAKNRKNINTDVRFSFSSTADIGSSPSNTDIKSGLLARADTNTTSSVFLDAFTESAYKANLFYAERSESTLRESSMLCEITRKKAKEDLIIIGSVLLDGEDRDNTDDYLRPPASVLTSAIFDSSTDNNFPPVVHDSKVNINDGSVKDSNPVTSVKLHDLQKVTDLDSNSRSKRKQIKQATESLRRAFIRIYKEMMKLQAFGVLNSSALMKIVSKFERIVSAPMDNRLVKDLPLYLQTDLGNAIDSVENTFAEFFCENNVRLARSALLQKQTGTSDYYLLYFGLRIGACLVLICWTMWVSIVDPRMHPSPSDNKWIKDLLPVYRGLGCILLLSWCWGLLVWVWMRYKINYAFIFQIEQEKSLDPKETWSIACNQTILALVNFLLFYKILRGDFPDTIPARIFPGALFIYFLVRFAWFFRPGEGSNSSHWASALFLTVSAPLRPTTFLTGFFGDILTSLTKVYTDLIYGTCWLFAGGMASQTHDEDELIRKQCQEADTLTNFIYPFFTFLPLWFRLQQCLRQYWDSGHRWPYLGNAGKYIVSQTVVIFGLFHKELIPGSVSQIGYLTCMVISALYSFTWDLTMDWSLGEKAHGYLRENLMFGSMWIYYVAIFADLILRFAWTVTLIPQTAGSPLPDSIMQYITPLLAVMEIFRRTFWAFFRLENEHLHQTAGVAQEIGFVPLYFDAPPKKPPASTSFKRVLAEVLSIVIAVVIIGWYAATS